MRVDLCRESRYPSIFYQWMSGLAMEIAGEELKTQAGHHGFMAGMCQEFDIAQPINQRIDNGDARRVVSPGQAVVAMIIVNGHQN